MVNIHYVVQRASATKVRQKFILEILQMLLRRMLSNKYKFIGHSKLMLDKQQSHYKSFDGHVRCGILNGVFFIATEISQENKN